MIKRAEGIVCHDGLLLMLEFCSIDVLRLRYKTRYLEMYEKDIQAAAQTSDTTNKSRLGRSTVSKAKRLLRELSDDEDEKSALAERPAHSRAYRAPVPELDIAFAMQLRPGLGLGSDPAWLVRFLMAMFGWMTGFIGNGAQTGNNRRAII